MELSGLGQGAAAGTCGVRPSVSRAGCRRTDAVQHRSDGQRLRAPHRDVAAAGSGAPAGLVGGRYPRPGDGGTPA
ncbi:hypothetical protein G6F46_014893 [Rhizopus delemar]|nr:hypothetical protein G6F32_015563 [Rhizopus arrhizus]KAG1585125.1 hypothetical protein G6F46_014893 [Rhizopus delemar]